MSNLQNPSILIDNGNCYNQNNANLTKAGLFRICCTSQKLVLSCSSRTI